MNFCVFIDINENWEMTEVHCQIVLECLNSLIQANYPYDRNLTKRMDPVPLLDNQTPHVGVIF